MVKRVLGLVLGVAACAVQFPEADYRVTGGTTSTSGGSCDGQNSCTACGACADMTDCNGYATTCESSGDCLEVGQCLQAATCTPYPSCCAVAGDPEAQKTASNLARCECTACPSDCGSTAICEFL